MKPVHQVPFDGRCMDACVASLFEKTLAEVNFQCPDRFYDEATNVFRCHNPAHAETWDENRFKCGNMDWQNDRVGEFVAPYGVVLTHVSVSHGHRRSPKAYDDTMLPPGLCLAAGPANRGHPHVVVWDTRLVDAERPLGRMVHDPHPDGTGIHRIEDFYWFEVADPHKLVASVPEGGVS